MYLPDLTHNSQLGKAYITGPQPLVRGPVPVHKSFCTGPQPHFIQKESSHNLLLSSFKVSEQQIIQSPTLTSKRCFIVKM